MNKVLTWLKNVTQSLEYLKKQNDELIWADIYNSTIANSSWFDQSVSPGRWAVGYPLLYVLYRILDEQNVNSILELGLGQSSKMTCCYTHTKNNVSHIIVDHNNDWTDFFSHNIDEIFDKSKLVLCDLDYNDVYEHYSYNGFKDSIPILEYDLIIVDGPYGSEHDSRNDILGIIPSRLASDFVIILDDCEREGEKETFEKLLHILVENGIDCSVGVYSGIKEVRVITSKSRSYLCTL